MTHELLPPVAGRNNPCLNCPPIVGFGAAFVAKDDETVFFETPDTEFEDCWTVAQAEAVAAADPDHDWRIVLDGPMHESNNGFA